MASKEKMFRTILYIEVEFWILKTVSINIMALRDVTPCSVVNGCQRFGETCSLL